MAANIILRRCSGLANGNKQHYSVIIAGGGLIGSTLALTLARNPLFKNARVLLIDASKRKEWKAEEKYSNRVSAINYSTKQLFQSVGVWNDLENARVQVIKDMKVWGHCSTNHIHFAHLDKNTAYIVENDLIVDTVYKALANTSNVEVLHETQLSNVKLPYSEDNNCPQVDLPDNPNLSCDLLVGADGANSLVRRAMNVQYLSWSYDQSAVVATLNVSTEGTNNIAWQRFMPEGPIALLPLKEGLSSLVWSTTKENANHLLKLSNDDFVDALNKTLVSPTENDAFVKYSNKFLDTLFKGFNVTNESGEILPPYVMSVEDGSRAAFPLGFGHSARYVAPKVALVGDAAHRVHPLAGQGVNLGFSDISILNKALSRGMNLGSKFGNLDDLRLYETESQRHNLPVMMAIDFMHRIYKADNSIMKAFGDACFRVANLETPIKRTMKKFASGF